MAFVPSQARSPLSARGLLFATWSLCDVVAACRVRSCAGEYTLTGVWVNETQTWALSPGTWLTNPCSYYMVGFSGTIDVVAGLRRFSGSVLDKSGYCTTFVLMELIPTGAPFLSFSPPFAQHPGLLLSTVPGWEWRGTQTLPMFRCSRADTRSDKPRRHQPADGHADCAADVGARQHRCAAGLVLGP